MRSRLPGQLARLAGEAGAAALTVDRWAITPRLCAEASALGLPVAAWTVNAAPVARRMAAAGVDRLTTDRVVEMRAAIGAQDGAATARCDG
jgi:glycerophosphoryl diester phosphodiesterase